MNVKTDPETVQDSLILRGYQETLFSECKNKKRASGGREVQASCLFCPSSDAFYYNTERPRWHCFSCGRGGDWIHFLEEKNGWGFPEALDYLKQEAGMGGELDPRALETFKSTRKRGDVLTEAHNLAREYLHTTDGARVRAYLKERGYKPKDIERMDVGALPDPYSKLTEALQKHGFTSGEIKEAGLENPPFRNNPLVFLWRDVSGRAVGITGRSLSRSPERKYINTASSYGFHAREHLYGLSQLKPVNRGDLVLVEGLMDAVYLQAHGVPAIALGGKSLTRERCQLLERLPGTRNLIFTLDGDPKGQEATAETLRRLLEDGDRRLKLYAVTIPGKEDPDSYAREKGIEALVSLTGSPKPAAEWLTDYYLQETGDSLKREAAITKTVELYTRTADPHGYERARLLETLQERTGITPEEVQSRIQAQKGRDAQEGAKKHAQNIQRKAAAKLKDGDTDGYWREFERGRQTRPQGSGITVPELYTLDSLRADLLQERPGFKTGIPKLDQEITIPAGALSVVAGRPSQGKTTLLFNMMLRMVEKYPEQAFYLFSYEERRQQILIKLTMALAGVRPSRDDGGPVHNGVEWYADQVKKDGGMVSGALRTLQEYMDSGRLQVIDESYHVEDLCPLIEAIDEERPGGWPLGAVFVDYFQKVNTRTPGHQRYTDLQKVSGLFLETAKRRRLPVILGAQAVRQAGGQDDGKAPVQLHHLRECGDLEQDAALVLAVMNLNKIEGGHGNKAMGVNILKQRMGNTLPVSDQGAIQLNMRWPCYKVTD